MKSNAEITEKEFLVSKLIKMAVVEIDTDEPYAAKLLLTEALKILHRD